MPNDAVLVDSDVFSKKYTFSTAAATNGEQVCRGHSKQMASGEDFLKQWKHPSFLFSRRVHRVRVTLRELLNSGTKNTLWDAEYHGKEDSPGSDYELGETAKPEESISSMPYFRYFCPPFNTNQKFELCVEDRDNNGFRECHTLEVGGTDEESRENMPELKPLMETTREWNGVMPVKNLGLVSTRAFANAGGVNAGEIPGEDGSGSTGSAGSHSVGSPHRSTSKHRLSATRFGKPRYPLLMGAREDPRKIPKIPMQLS
ncbi:unnamed protein product [Amoebophrya sp. A120]|nr:unnamed protein product [Amoebophrya sp. A120]|eukprot:GSA120T00012312001.1